MLFNSKEFLLTAGRNGVSSERHWRADDYRYTPHRAMDIAKVLTRMLNEAANYTDRTGVIERRRCPF
ncbi:hypothetical protein L829_3529 [Mycobacteroides abscessus MAB_030201_1075]|uniref:Uncharacterized protein n=1 Tax=Mycobacteroides abscessus MAB_030201_1075 TaxID=1335410 RepID=A0A829PS33_9MYCO|nr:hypothetical protein L835_0630 [Mycobacteroides abscessus MAB_110811_1470]ETZ89951.1 hypothetical protein L829_3529 [Mycobacteroides abscessus MAB_030201_1075]ETZ91606.1 hypothetical protein L828_0652 [Mycobacteroides abscessus MAB_030201_1061]